MALRWTQQGDLARLHEFLASVDPKLASAAVRAVLAGVRRIPIHPLLGRQLPEYSPREVRRWLAGDHEVRHELRGADLFILRSWHTQEDR